jgi:hypothetical protein
MFIEKDQPEMNCEQRARDLLKNAGIKNSDTLPYTNLAELINVLVEAVADKRDADRYRKLRTLANPSVDGPGGSLEAFVACAQLDFISTAHEFDRVIDEEAKGWIVEEKH